MKLEESFNAFLTKCRKVLRLVLHLCQPIPNGVALHLHLEDGVADAALIEDVIAHLCRIFSSVCYTMMDPLRYVRKMLVAGSEPARYIRICVLAAYTWESMRARR